jgi:hypothetical protein
MRRLSHRPINRTAHTEHDSTASAAGSGGVAHSSPPAEHAMVPHMALKDVAGQITAGAAEAGVHDEGRGLR